MTFKNQMIIQAREGLSEEKLSEYKDIFSFFDRWQEQIIAQITQSPLFKLSVFRDGGGTITTVELGQVTNFDKLLETEGEAIICLVFCEEH